MQVAGSNCKAYVLDESERCAVGSFRAELVDLTMVSRLLRLTRRVLLEGMTGSETRHFDDQMATNAHVFSQ